MLSKRPHRFSAYDVLPSSNMMSTSHVHSGLHTLLDPSQCALQQFEQHIGSHKKSLVHRNPNSKNRQHLDAHGPARERSVSSSGMSGPIRRRISRAYDQCNQLRSKCDGQSPCSHCIECGLGCEYMRERKKRGKASRKDLAQQAAAATANRPKSPTGHSSDDCSSPAESRHGYHRTTSAQIETSDCRRPQATRTLSLSTKRPDNNCARDTMEESLRSVSLKSLAEISNMHQAHMADRAEVDQIQCFTSLNVNSYPSTHDYRPAAHYPHISHINYTAGQGNFLGYDLLYAIQTSSQTHYPGTTYSPFLLVNSPIPGSPTSSDHPLTGDWMPSSRGGSARDYWNSLLTRASRPCSTSDETSSNCGQIITNGVALGAAVTYTHLATIISARDYQGAIQRWQNAAWSLVRVLELARDLAQVELQHPADQGYDDDPDGEDEDLPISSISKEERGERRRKRWLCYSVDLYLALCHNMPLFLLDIECDDLLQPMEHTLWQAGSFYIDYSSIHITSPNCSPRIRRRGPEFERTWHSVFEHFLPLMRILGEIVDVENAENHPRFRVGIRLAQDRQESEARSIGTSKPDGKIEGNAEPKDIVTPSICSVRAASSANVSEAEIQIRIAVAHVMRVLHISLTRKWDLTSLLDDNDLWTSSQSLLNATGHVVIFARAPPKSSIGSSNTTPRVDVMLFFFGVFPLQDEFLLLLIADQLQVEVSSSEVRAYETIVHTHEAWVAALNTEYKRFPHGDALGFSSGPWVHAGKFERAARAAATAQAGSYAISVDSGWGAPQFL
ncbi:hypothetical protein BUE80_DR003519 [Diplocarpon rosae]|nr:hypothetical protein BUE80_DR003519 [Diplocarpon rosae]